MKNLTIFTREFPPVLLGGIGNTARFLSEELLKQDFNVNIITLKFGPYSKLKSFEEINNLKIYRLQIRERLFFWYKTAVFSWLNKKILKHTDLIHLLNMRDAPFIYKPCPVIANVNDYVPAIIPLNPFKYPYKEKNKFAKYFHYNFWKFIDYTSLKRADFIVPNSHYIWKVIGEKYNLKNKKHKVIHKGIDVNEFTKEYQKNIDLLFVGSPFGQKGATEFIKAVSIIKEKNKKISSVMIGRPSKYDFNYDKLIKKFNLEKNIKIIDFLPHKQLIDFYLKSRLFVLPTYRDSIPQSIMEAMAAKLPVVTTNVGGIPELVADRTGFMVSPQNVKPLVDRISFLLENDGTRKKMGKAGYERVRKEFNFKSTIHNYLKLYNEH